jgi:two-component system CheB/CheR fusion protein
MAGGRKAAMSADAENKTRSASRKAAPKGRVRDVTSDAASPAAQKALLVVGIGASAGGLEAFRAFFSALPPDTGMAFILVQHLDPVRNSSLAEILSGWTTMTVSAAEDGAAIAPNRVFVIPPDAILKIEGGVLRISRPASTTARQASIDTFLTSLAEDQGEDAVGIILSGFGADGAIGVEAIKEHGGLTLAQAEHDHAPKPGMPSSATARGYVDHVLAVADMPAALVNHLRYRSHADGAKGPDGLHPDLGDHLGAICAILSSRLGRDFSQYKSNTLMRRVQRRMQVLQVDTVPAYLEQLRERSSEPGLLFREVLIRVTRFFRDPAAFEALAARIPALLEQGSPQEAVRVWVPGCATGEEAYTLAILFKEAMASAARPRKVQIFATDVDDKAVEVARAGLYPDTVAADLPGALLDRHFLAEGDQVRVSKEIRQMCLFSVHDLVKDPPFSRLDLISCRNLLIYFAQPLQKQVLTMFHYGLQPGGLLMLGLSEAVTAQAGLFTPLDKKHRLFERKDVPPQLMATARQAPLRAVEPPPRATAEGPAEAQISRIMARYAPAFVVIDRRQNALQFSGPIGKYLEPVIGTPGLSLPALIHPDLRGPLRSAIKEATANGRRVIVADLVVETTSGREAVNMIVEPLPPAETDGAFIVAFQDLGAARPAGILDVAARESEAAAIGDLVAARERLQTLTEELETSNEELQSSNEEYQSVNEELQSANEELETSKEELQSINEELATVNAELASRNESLVEVNSDLANLIDSTSIATLFLDRDLRIKRFTPAVLDIFSVRKGDEGRPITDLVSRLSRDGLQEDVQQVIRTLMPVEREVTLAAGDNTYQMQIRPYRNVNDVINGVVITFVDISARKRHEVDRARLAAIVQSSEDAIFSHDLEGRLTSWNAGAQAIYGYTAEEMISQPMSQLLSEAQAEEWPTLLQRLIGGDRIRHFDSTRQTKDGGRLEVSLTLSPIRDSEERVIGVSAIARDITERKRMERASALLLGELDHRVKNILAIVSSVVTQTLETAATPADFAASIDGRVKAIAKAHSLLTDGDADGVSLRSIVNTELAPYSGLDGRVEITGGEVVLTPNAAMPVALAIHELTTNAAKYGALSAPSGRVVVSWACDGDAPAQRLTIDWAESGGPAVQPDPVRGFGTALIERGLAYQFGASVDRVFADSGVRCSISLPMTDDIGRANGRGGR